MSFIKPPTTFVPAPFGFPAGTPGRGTQQIRGIVLHDLDLTLEAYDAQVTQGLVRNKPHPEHISLHYALDYAGNVHQYVLDANVAWGIDDFDFGHYPSVHPAGNPLWSLLAVYPSDPPDTFVLHVATMSGNNPPNTHTVFTSQMLTALYKLLGYLCHTYSLTADAAHLVTHNMLDGQYFEQCVEEDYPLSQIVALTAAYIAAGGDPALQLDTCTLGNSIHPGTPVNIVGKDSNGCLVSFGVGAGILGVQETSTVNPTVLSGGILAEDVRISNLAGNAASAQSDGLYVPSGSPPNRAYFRYLDALLDPMAIEPELRSTFSYTITPGTPKYVLTATQTQAQGLVPVTGFGVGAVRYEVRNPAQPALLNGLTNLQQIGGSPPTIPNAFILNPGLLVSTNFENAYYTHLQELTTLPTQLIELDGSGTPELFLPGPYGSLITGLTLSNLYSAYLITPFGCSIPLWDYLPNAAAQLQAASFHFPVSKGMGSQLSASNNGGGGQGSITFVQLPADWSHVPDQTYLFRDDFMGNALDMGVWNRVQHILGEMEIEPHFHWLRLFATGGDAQDTIFTRTGFARATGRVFLCDFSAENVSSGGSALLGWMDGLGYSYTNFAHGLAILPGNIFRIYEGGTDRTSTVNYTPHRIYRLRITLGNSNNAVYELQGGPEFPPIGGATWYNFVPASSSNSAATLYAGLYATSSPHWVSDVRVY